MRRLKAIVVYLLTVSMTISLIACSNEVQLESDSEKEQVDVIYCPTYNPEDAQNAMLDFSVRLFKVSVNGSDKNRTSEKGNVLIAPTSVLIALAMTANGAQNETLAQMEEVFGIACEPLRDYMKLYIKNLPEEETYKLHMANSIWIKDDEEFLVNEDFIEINENFLDANVFEKEFSNKTLREINDWVNEHTDGMIEEVLEEIPKDAVMYLINALAFEAEWEEIYKETQIHHGKFTLVNGITQDVEFMYSQEGFYLEDEKVTGFVKYYKDRKYAFVALLPNEGVSISDYLETMSGIKLKELLEHPQEIQVNAAIPKFEVEYNALLNTTLKEMGMIDIFEPKKADLSGIGTHTTGNLYVDKVIHKTHMQVDEKGTKAGATTAVEMKLESAVEMIETKTVRLDRPFIYMIIDCEMNQPVFMGTLEQVVPLARCGVVDICGYPTAEEIDSRN